MMRRDVVFFQKGIKIGPLHTNSLGCMGDITLACLEGFEEKGLLYAPKDLLHKMLFAGVQFFQGFGDPIALPGTLHLQLL